ncbi:inner membrane protein YccF [mine drainage metagenome]|uniref:Inner membrane protein YccF n=1 Tax=mine drainage metagenome TaxID=410659 RepID=A0A1J5R1Z7_9ZZZZ
MRLLGNLIWFVFGGFVMGLGWWFAALLCAITIVGIPLAIASFRIGTFSFWPFGRRIVDKPAGAGRAALGLLGNVIWAVFFGWWLALGHLVSALLCAITIIGIPFALQHLKLAGLSLTPFGKVIVAV